MKPNKLRLSEIKLVRKEIDMFKFRVDKLQREAMIVKVKR